MEENNFPSSSNPSTSKELEDVYESDSSDSSDVEKCPICLLAFSSNQEIGKPAICDHKFCFPCIQEWSKVVQTCPIDRKEFQEILVYGDLECDHLLRSVAVKERVALNELITAEEFTSCEICRTTDREDCMLLCDGCDKGFHMDCLEPPLLEVPQGNWYCDDCFDSSDESEDDDDPEEVDDLNNDIEEVIGDLPESRLRVRQQQPQILRTLQSERIRNAILARMSLRSARESFGEGPSTSAPVAARPKAVRKRRKRKARRRARRVVVEYDVDGSDKFAMKTRRVKRRKVGKKRRKVVKAAKRKSASAAPSTGFKNVNANVYELQRGRAMAGLSNFNIFQPTNQLDYVPDDDGLVDDSGIDETAENSSGSVLTQAIISLSNPLRRNLIIKSRVLQNCTTTSSEPNLLDSIMQDQEMFGPGSIRKKFAVEKSSGKLLFVGKNADGAKQAAGGDGSKESKPAETPASKPSTGNDPSTVPNDDGTSSNQLEANRSSDDRDESQNHPIEHLEAPVDNKPKNKPKKPAFDMFDENSAPEEIDDCPNFSIYDSVDALVEQETSQHRPNVYDEENVDLVQMSDGEHPNESPPAIVASQPASPDLENDKVGEMLPERSYTPPLMQKTSDDGPEKDENERKKKEKESKRKRELERYNVRDRLKDRSPPKVKDKFGRNRSRSRSNSRKKQPRKRSNSRRSKDRNYRSRSRSRRRTPSIEYDRKKKAGYKDKPKRSNRRTRSRSPRNHRPMTPDRRARSRSKKAKRKKHREYSKEKPSTLTKEVFTSGPNILVSVNFNNQEEKSTKRSRSRDREEPKDIVDITARKKITISSKPVAIIDLARSPFRELTPEYQSNVIELSDSETEKTSEKRTPKSPDSSSKLYDPFDILNSPPNENVTSSQNTAAMALQKLPEKKLPEPAKGTFTYNKNIMALAASGSLFFNEENLVSSSSSLIPLEKLLPLPLVSKAENEKPEVVPMDIAESPYSPGHEYDDSFQDQGDNAVLNRQAKGGNKGANIFDELFGSSTPPGLDKAKGSSGKKGAPADKSVDHSNKYLMKMKRQERVIEEVKLVIKPYYSKRTITKEQYKEILRKAVPKICHSREINPQKIKVLIDSYVKIFKHRKKRSAPEEIF